MFWTSTFFYWIATVELICLVLLSVGVTLVYFLPRPIERLRTIQATIVALMLACLLQAAHVLPQTSLGWLAMTEPTDQVDLAEIAAVPAAGFATTSNTTTFRAADAPDFAERSSGLPGHADPFSRTLQTTSSAGAEGGTSESAEFAATGIIVNGTAAARAWRLFQVAAVALFATGAVWSLAHLLPGIVRLRRIWRRSQPASAELEQLLQQVMRGQRRAVTLRISSEIDVPVAFGARRGRILLPESIARTGDSDTLRYCLAHEWSHVRNYDVAQWWGLQLCQSILWCQPLFWILRRELRVCQDQIADDFAAQQTADPLSYAQLLIDLARQARGTRIAMALTMADGRSGLARRIRSLTDGSYRLTSIGRSGVLAASALVLGAAAFGVALVDLSVAQADEPAPLAIAPTGAVAITSAETDAPVPEPEKPAAEKADPEAKPEAKPTTEKELKYFGVVMDKVTKEPIEGVNVTVRRSIYASGRNDIVEETKHTTNDRGVFRFVIPPEQVAEPYLYIELDVTHPKYAEKSHFGYSLAMIRKNLKNGDPPFFTNTELDPADPLTGRIVDPAGKPLANVSLLAYSVGAPSSPDKFEYGSFMRGKSAEDGTFQLNLVKGGNAMLWIAPDKLAPRQLLLGNKKGDLGDLQMAEGVSTNGQVIDANGKPVAGVWVNLEDQAAQKEITIPVASALRRSTLTDADGRFELDPVKPGSYKLEVDNHPSDMRFNAQKAPKVKLPAVFMTRTVTVSAPPQPLLVQASPHVQFLGQYVDSKGKNCRGHEVMIAGRMNGEHYFTRLEADEDGRIQGMLPHGLEQARMDLITNEHSSLRYRIGKDKPLVRDPHSFMNIGTLDHDIVDVEIVRYVAPIVTLNVVDEQGARVPSAKVAGIYLGSDDKSMISPVGGLPTNLFFERQLDGRRRSSQMLPDEKTKFVARADGYTDAEQELTLAEGETKELVLVLKRAEKSDKPSDDSEAAGESKPKSE